MKPKLIKLIDVKTIVTFALIGTVCYLAISSRIRISEEFFAAIVTSVITYFFTKRANGDDIQK